MVGFAAVVGEEIDEILGQPQAGPAAIRAGHLGGNICRSVDEIGGAAIILDKRTIILDGKDILVGIQIVVGIHELGIIRVEGIAGGDDLIAIGDGVGVAIRACIDMRVEVEAGQKGPGGCLVGATILIDVGCDETTIRSTF